MIRRCAHCSKAFNLDSKPKGWMANHSRWCSENPLRNQYLERLAIARSSKNSFRNQYAYGVEMTAETKAKISRAATGRRHSIETCEVLREKALKSPHRRLKRRVVEYRGVLLDSQWELELARRLDSLRIQWTRPNPLPWVDENDRSHHYFPDFYLPEIGIYLDPKNPQAERVQSHKLKLLLQQHPNIVILRSLKECREFLDPRDDLRPAGNDVTPAASAHPAASRKV